MLESMKLKRKNICRTIKTKTITNYYLQIVVKTFHLNSKLKNKVCVLDIKFLNQINLVSKQPFSKRTSYFPFKKY